jgi:hypothetical protein
MKRILLILSFIFVSILSFSQIDYNNYIGDTKREITSIMKNSCIKYSVEKKLYVDIDSTGKWFLDDNHHTYLIYYEDIKALFTFDNKSGRCVKYFLLCENLNNYWDYFDFYNQTLEKVRDQYMTWISKESNCIIVMNAVNSKHFQIFVKQLK